MLSALAGFILLYRRPHLSRWGRSGSMAVEPRPKRRRRAASRALDDTTSGGSVDGDDGSSDMEAGAEVAWPSQAKRRRALGMRC